MRLISEEEYDRYKQQKLLKEYDPKLAVMANAATNANILLNEKQKPRQGGLSNLRFQLQQYQRAMDTYRSLQKNPATPLIEGLKTTLPTSVISPPITLGTETEAEAADEEEEEVPTGDIGSDLDEGAAPPPEAQPELTAGQKTVFALALKSVPNLQKSKASSAIEFIKNMPEKLTVNEKNELVIKGKAQANSNFIDLFTALYAPKSSKKPLPVHYPIFKEALLSFNVPNAFLPSSFQSGHGLSLKSVHFHAPSRPPGHKPQILRLYK